MPTPAPTPYGRAPCASPGFLLWNAALAWQRAMTAALRPLGLTPVQFVILACVASFEDEGVQPNQLMICARARTGVTMTSQVLTKLVHADLVSRITNPNDGRANVVGITARGDELVQAGAEVAAAVDDEFFGDRRTDVFALHALVPEHAHG
jgi:DNA-binding MarR family transcriptional regulator